VIQNLESYYTNVSAPTHISITIPFRVIIKTQFKVNGYAHFQHYIKNSLRSDYHKREQPNWG